jgi:hypothetical protein
MKIVQTMDKKSKSPKHNDSNSLKKYIFLIFLILMCPYIRVLKSKPPKHNDSNILLSITMLYK